MSLVDKQLLPKNNRVQSHPQHIRIWSFFRGWIWLRGFGDVGVRDSFALECGYLDEAFEEGFEGVEVEVGDGLAVGEQKNSVRPPDVDPSIPLVDLQIIHDRLSGDGES